MIYALIFLLLTSCTLEEKRQEAMLKNKNQTGELILRKDQDKDFSVSQPIPSPPPVYPWTK